MSKKQTKVLKIIKGYVIPPLILCGAIFLYCGIFENQVFDPWRINKVEKAIAKRNFDKARVYSSKIAISTTRDEYVLKTNLAELNYVLDQNGVSDANFLANELNLKQEFLMALAKNVPQLLSAGQAQQLIDVLAGWPFDYSFSDKAESVFDQYYSEAITWVKDSRSRMRFNYNSNEDRKRIAFVCNIFYNEEVTTYNSVVDGVMNYAIVNKDSDLAKKIIQLYRPLAKESSRRSLGHRHYDYTYKLSDESKNAAIAKARANGLKL